MLGNFKKVSFFYLVKIMVRIIVKSGYMKGKSHKEYYVNYIATREGVEKFKSDYGNMKATKKQQKLIQQLIKDYPTATGMFEYNDFKEVQEEKDKLAKYQQMLEQVKEQIARIS